MVPGEVIGLAWEAVDVSSTRKEFEEFSEEIVGVKGGLDGVVTIVCWESVVKVDGEDGGIETAGC